MRDAELSNKGTTFHKTMQILAYAGVIDILAKSQRLAEEVFLAFEVGVGLSD